MAKLIELIERRFDYDYGEVMDKAVSVVLELDEGSRMRVYFGEGSPEDARLFRDLSDAYEIATLVRAAYELGKDGKELEFITTVDEEEAY